MLIDICNMTAITQNGSW